MVPGRAKITEHGGGRHSRMQTRWEGFQSVLNSVTTRSKEVRTSVSCFPRRGTLLCLSLLMQSHLKYVGPVFWWLGQEDVNPERAVEDLVFCGS